jgi:hypothetical protein
MAAYATLYARDAAGPAVALRTALLASALPFFFLVGWLMTPDAPLAAAWAAALYYLQRALIDGRSRAWIGAGVAIGVGMLSKYSMILVPAAAFAFVLLDVRSRRVLVSPWAWAGVAVALTVFAPVIVWNVQHDWASFTFQGARRLDTRRGLRLSPVHSFRHRPDHAVGDRRARHLARGNAAGDARTFAGGCGEARGRIGRRCGGVGVRRRVHAGAIRGLRRAELLVETSCWTGPICSRRCRRSRQACLDRARVTPTASSHACWPNVGTTAR